MRKRVLGEEHPDTLTSMVNLASTYRNQGRWKEVEELEERVMEMIKRVHAPIKTMGLSSCGVHPHRRRDTLGLSCCLYLYGDLLSTIFSEYNS